MQPKERNLPIKAIHTTVLLTSSVVSLNAEFNDGRKTASKLPITNEREKSNLGFFSAFKVNICIIRSWRSFL